MAKPVILPEYKSEAEEAFEIDPIYGDLADASWIPGYSEVIRANEIAAVDDFVWMEQHRSTGLTKQHVLDKVIKCQPRPLPVRFMWLRTTGIDGSVNAQVTSDLRTYKRWGYRPAIWPTDFEKYGFGFPPAGHKEADGTIRREDTALFVVDDRAARERDKYLAEEVRLAENPTTRSGADTGVDLETVQNERETVTVNYSGA